MEGDMRKKRGDNAALWCSTIRLVVLPVCDLSHFEHSADKSQELSILTLFLSQLHEDFMADVLEVALHVDIDKPCGARPAFLHCP